MTGTGTQVLMIVTELRYFAIYNSIETITLLCPTDWSILIPTCCIVRIKIFSEQNTFNYYRPWCEWFNAYNHDWLTGSYYQKNSYLEPLSFSAHLLFNPINFVGLQYQLLSRLIDSSAELCLVRDLSDVIQLTKLMSRFHCKIPWHMAITEPIKQWLETLPPRRASELGGVIERFLSVWEKHRDLLISKLF